MLKFVDRRVELHEKIKKLLHLSKRNKIYIFQLILWEKEHVKKLRFSRELKRQSWN